MSGQTMKAVVISAPMDFALKDVPLPDCPPGGMLLRVHACGLCGSDLRTLRHGHSRVELPWIVGHEISGTVVETGEDCRTQWAEGEMLAVGPVVYCGECEFCMEGRYEFCEGYREIAQAWPGGFAEYVAVPEEAVRLGNVHRIPDGLDPAVAALSEPVSSCVNAQERGEIGLGDTVVVIGAGPIGCIHVALARARGADRIIVADVNAARLALCAPFEPDCAIDASDTDLVEEVRRITGGKGAEVVITANPAPATQVQAVEMARKAGRILLFGGLPKDRSKPGIDTNIVHYRALTLIGTTTFAPRHQRVALQLLASGRVPGEKLLTHRFPLSEFAEAVELAMQGKALKAVILP